MPGSSERQRGSFVAAAAVVMFVSIVVVRLPDALLSRIAQNRPLTDAQAGWATRLIIAAAVLQALYVGFAILRPEKVEISLLRSPKLQAKPSREVASSVTRNAAATILLTMVYGVALLAATGERGTFVVFPLLALAQAAWYVRLTDDVAGWLRAREAVLPAPCAAAGPRATPAEYVPPLVRGADPDDE